MTDRVHPTRGFSPRTELAAQALRPIFARIAKGAVTREQDRVLAHDAVRWLLDAGFGALRVPVRHGGTGATLTETFALLAELAEADSNLPQIFRAHFAFVEGRLHEGDSPQAARWLERVAQGALFGAAMAELTDSTGTATTLTPGPGREGWRLDGTKYYSTGTLYASWIVAVATDGVDRIQLAVPATAPGVTRVDDWDGFGQRLTGSGTTIFENVAVPEGNILGRTPLADFPTNEYFTTYYQLFHLATLAGIGRAIVGDATAFVRPRTRTFGIPGQVAQRHDPLVQGVVGRLSALSFSADTLVEKVAAGLENVFPAWAAGQESGPAFDLAQVQAYQAQQIVAPQVLEAANLLFEVGGASATSATRRLDRHWRNARTLASHNPLVQRQRELGDLVLNGTAFGAQWRARTTDAAPQADPARQHPERVA
ncbi:Dibenzothiophene desulfurization enzyme C [Gluconacetobacter sp. SXCC-1]|uniref:Acyl-CoA dehydrogenase n=1 Tax=Komagataeibacter rhaeticus TaxID=215221 RepID=A0A181C9M1_9PROT|nr:acyl-CoA dehydrogenase family protein [Komagataeibacter rhaeticus]ATU73175.1 acyl-CoA dehydrogenase [Komagataeibacter xylinus]EGG76919.1 Dibenzothiophene desulfurization enzyme C [Gluconacetobacter sp. SXCC-1]QIP35080.1 acyl-CoA dehydrogenase [Komagataeibacter rhaeticus]QOC47635.1 acyl-CoA dehydrogenase family protein [Komagataeibacter rhaeticus]WPP23016.1 acyl-CoA dehydrogenase family protein [Komagataeibacter rhaeticus]